MEVQGEGKEKIVYSCTTNILFLVIGTSLKSSLFFGSTDVIRGKREEFHRGKKFKYSISLAILP